MKLTLIDPTSHKSFEVVWIEALTPDGSFVIQNGHAETTLVLAQNRDLVYCFTTGKQEALTLKKGGILEVKRDKVVVLIG